MRTFAVAGTSWAFGFCVALWGFASYSAPGAAYTIAICGSMCAIAMIFAILQEE